MDKEELEKKYNSGISTRQIAIEYQCSQKTICRTMKEFGIKTRTLSESQKVCKTSWFKKPKTKEWKEMMSKKLTITGEKQNAKEYRSMARQLFEGKCVKCGTQEELCVHHINGIHTDNKANNLQFLCKSCHAYIHMIDKPNLKSIKEHDEIKSKIIN